METWPEKKFRDGKGLNFFNLAIKYFETESVFKKGLNFFKNAKRRNVLRLLHARLDLPCLNCCLLDLTARKVRSAAPKFF